MFGDHEIFRLVIELVRAGKKDAAAKMAESLPKNRGYFQEMRNAVPQLIHAGELDLPFQILASFKPITLADQVIIEFKWFINLEISNAYTFMLTHVDLDKP